MPRTRRPTVLFSRSLPYATALTLALVVLFQCGRAGGVEDDPLDREAQQAFVRYLQIDTSNPPGNETAGAKFLQDLLTKNGIEATLVGADPKRQSVYARIRSGSNKKALLLLHHIDVVPVVASQWTKPPFSGLQSGGYIWGRGALDIKSLGIAEAIALIDLKRRAVPLDRDIIYLGVADEEAGGLRGAAELLDKRPELFENVGFVLNEGGYNETIVDKVAFWGVEVQQKIPLWLHVDIHGMAGHSASPPDDGGTVMRAFRLLTAIQQIPTPYRLTPTVTRYFHALGTTKPDERGVVMRAIGEPLDRARIEHVLSAGYRSLLRDTIAVTRFNAGTSVNAIPAHAIADIDMRLMPDEKPDDMIAKAREIVGKNGEVTVLVSGLPVPESPSDTELFAVLERAMHKSDPGSVVAPFVGAGTSDSRFFRARGITAYGFAPFKVNYYDADTVHGVDERIRARFFTEGVRLTRTIVDDFCAKHE